MWFKGRKMTMAQQVSLRSTAQQQWTVKMQQQHMQAWFSPLQKFGYPEETLLPLHAGIQAKLSPLFAPWIVQQRQADRRTSTVQLPQLDLPPLSLTAIFKAVKETVFLCSQVTSPGEDWKTGIGKKPSKQFTFNLHIILFSRQWMCLWRSLNV